MEDIRIAENAKSITLPDGTELPYCEFGEDNDEVIVTGAVYFITYNTFLKALARRYHVYGFIMRLDGEGSERNADGTVNMARQWSKDIYEATRALGIDKFHYVGKCHSAIPGWVMLKEHPEAIKSLTSIGQTLHTCEQDADQWDDLQKSEGPQFMLRTLKKHKLLPLKVKEAQTVGTTLNVGDDQATGGFKYYGSHPEAAWDSYDDVRAFVPTITTPTLHIFALQDILYGDFKTANLWSMHNIPGTRSVLLQSERHLLEMDMPERLADEVLFFIDELGKPFE